MTRWVEAVLTAMAAVLLAAALPGLPAAVGPSALYKRGLADPSPGPLDVV